MLVTTLAERDKGRRQDALRCAEWFLHPGDVLQPSGVGLSIDASRFTFSCNWTSDYIIVSSAMSTAISRLWRLSAVDAWALAALESITATSPH